MKIAVTGATGFVGRSAVAHLAAAGHDVVAFSRRPATDPAVRALLALGAQDYVAWEIAEPLAAPPAVEAVIHCAADVAAAAPRQRAEQVNVAGTANALRAFADAPRFVQISSASVYGTAPDARPLTEDRPLPPASAYPGPYGPTKAAAERLILASGRSAIILRPRAVYGPGDTTLLPRLLAARRGGVLPLPGDGRNPVAITAIGNLCHAIDRALAYDGSGTFNVADAETPTLRELLTEVFAALGQPTRLLPLPAWSLATAAKGLAWWWRLARRPGEPRLTPYAIAQLRHPCVLDLTRARSVLGYTPQPLRAATLAACAAELREATSRQAQRRVGRTAR